MTKINKAKSRKFVVYYNRDLLEIKITDSEWSDIALQSLIGDGWERTV